MQTSEALYDIGGGALTVGQTVSFRMDNGLIDSGGTVGWSLQNIGSSSDRLQFLFNGGDTFYRYGDGSGFSDTAVSFTSGGLDFSITLTATDAYSFSISPIGGSSQTITGSLGGTSGTGIDRIRFYNYNAGGGSDKNVYFNSIEVIPEPSHGILLGLFAGALMLLDRRRR